MLAAALAAWLALDWRGHLARGETVPVLGVGGSVGQVAVQAARLPGAAFVLAAARSDASLVRACQNGADATVQLAIGQEPRPACPRLRQAATP